MTLDDIKQQDHFSAKDKKFMKLALQVAKKAQKIGEIPIGAVLVGPDGEVLSLGHNIREIKNTVIGHAEIMALHQACKKTKSWRLNNCTLYVTLEPCFMCAGALSQSRISRVVFGAFDPKGGALKSLAELGTDTRLNHRFEVHGGLMLAECRQLLKEFFKAKRRK